MRGGGFGRRKRVLFEEEEESRGAEEESRGAVWSAFGFLSGSLAGLSVMRGILLLLSACPFHLSGELFSPSLDCVQTSRLHVAGPKSWVGKESRDFFLFLFVMLA